MPRQRRVMTADVARLLDTGLAYRQVAEILGCTPGWISAIAIAELGRRRKPPVKTTTSMRRQAVALAREGRSTASIAQLLAVNPSTVNLWLERAGVMSGTKAQRLAKQAAALDLWRKGFLTETVCSDVEVSPTTLFRWVRAAGLPSRGTVHGSERETLRQLWAQGCSVAHIERMTGRSKGALRRATCDLPRRRKNLTPQERATMLALRALGLSFKQICQTTERGMSTVKRVLSGRRRIRLHGEQAA